MNMRRMPKSRVGTLLLAPLLALALACALSGCDEKKPSGSSGTSAKSSGAEGSREAVSSQVAEATTKPRMGLMMYKRDPYVSTVCQKIQTKLEGKAIVVEYDADNDQMRQNRQIDEIIVSGVDVLLINLVDVQTGAGMVDKVRKAGIPAIFFNREPDLNVIRSYSKACFVGTRVDDAGNMQGEIIKQLWDRHSEYDRNKDGVFQFVMLQGPLDNPETLGRTVHSVRRAQELGVKMRAVGESHICDWDEKLGAEAMRLALSMHGGDIELVISNNDAMALGAIQALGEKGFNRAGGPADKFIPVVGVDAIPPAVEAIRKGVMSATVEQDSAAMADAIASLALNAVAGKDFLEGTPYVWQEEGAIRIPYKVFGAEVKASK